MLIYMSLYVSEENQADFGVDIISIQLSVALAVAHILLEFVQLSYEAKACMTSMSNYAIACFNGKFAQIGVCSRFRALHDLFRWHVCAARNLFKISCLSLAASMARSRS